jgi:hypothetical protein
MCFHNIIQYSLSVYSTTLLTIYVADEMGLWHNEIVPVSELTYASFQEGIPCKDGRYLLPDPLSARIAPLTQPNAMLFTCQPPTNRSSYLKTKQLNPGWYVEGMGMWEFGHELIVIKGLK